MSSVKEVEEKAGEFGKAILRLIESSGPPESSSQRAAVEATRLGMSLLATALVDLHRLADAAEDISRRSWP